MKKYLVLLLILLWGGVYSQDERIQEEFAIHIKNPLSNDSTFFKMHLISTCWDAIDTLPNIHDLTNDYPGTILSSWKSSVPHQRIEWRSCWANRDVPFKHRFGLGRYKIMASVDSTFSDLNDWFFLDWRNSSLPEDFNNGQVGGDIMVYFDESERIFYWDSQLTNPINNASETWWGLKGLSANTADLEPFPPYNFYLSTHNNHPKLNWNHSPQLDYLTNYAVYRGSSDFGPFTKVATLSASATNWVDWEYVSGKMTTVYYKMVAVNGNRESEFTPTLSMKVNPAKEGNPESSKLEFALLQNYPNPFNPSTTITFSIPNQELVILQVYDSLGKEVAELISEVKDAGKYKINFNAENLPSGIYFYTINVGQHKSTKKFLLIK